MKSTIIRAFYKANLNGPKARAAPHRPCAARTGLLFDATRRVASSLALECISSFNKKCRLAWISGTSIQSTRSLICTRYSLALTPTGVEAHLSAAHASDVPLADRKLPMCLHLLATFLSAVAVLYSTNMTNGPCCWPLRLSRGI
jgi:hypothetical protein